MMLAFFYPSACFLTFIGVGVATLLDLVSLLLALTSYVNRPFYSFCVA